MNLSGSPVDYLIVFFGGVLLSFSPCVYPLLPVSLGYITSRAAGSRLEGFLLGLIYTTGVAVTYSLLGLFASLSGKIFGEISSKPLTQVIVGVIVILFGLSLLELIALPLPFGIKAGGGKSKGYLGIFFLGLSSGLTVSSCITPVLGAILAYLASRQNIFYGMSLLFVFAFGMGMIFILAGTFSALLVSLPKAGKWMLQVKRACGVLLIGMGVYFIYNAIGRT